MTISYMRDMLERHTKYSGSDKWRAKVRRMPDDQILAIYTRFVQSKLFTK